MTLNHKQRAQLAQATVQILKQGYYQTPEGQVNLAGMLAQCVNHTRGYAPAELAALQAQVLAQPAAYAATHFEVRNETTLQASARLAAAAVKRRIGVLNFASARKPGGGFLGGAQAQEESLARSSGLYPSLLQCPDFYAHHRAHKTSLYSDRMIYSPQCPVFRDDAGQLLAQPYCVDVITSPAPNAGAIAQNEPESLPNIEPTLRERMAKILSLALDQQCAVLILGAWGCGVFKNDPVRVAALFQAQLGPGQPFWGRFAQVVFAVLDTTADQRIYRPFHERFGG